MNKTKSKSRETKNIPTIQLNPNNTSKNQISLTKDQLRSLIQKNIHKKIPQEAEKKIQITEKSVPRSTKRKLDHTALAVNLYNQNTEAPHKFSKRKETFKKVFN